MVSEYILGAPEKNMKGIGNQINETDTAQIISQTVLNLREIG
jgi:hypothetical protein